MPIMVEKVVGHMGIPNLKIGIPIKIGFITNEPVGETRSLNGHGSIVLRVGGSNYNEIMGESKLMVGTNGIIHP